MLLGVKGRSYSEGSAGSVWPRSVCAQAAQQDGARRPGGDSTLPPCPRGSPARWAPRTAVHGRFVTQLCVALRGSWPQPSSACTSCNPAPVSSPQSEACRTLAPERDKAAKSCCIQLPDGTANTVLVRAGLSIKEVLSGLCEQHGINGAAVDLFLVGGDKVLGLKDPRPLPWGALPGVGTG